MKKIKSKPRLLLLSDLWGEKRNHWVDLYIKVLAPHYSIKYYDCCQLGEIDISHYSQEALHSQFVNGGIGRAVDNLLTLEQEEVNILAFSVGGIIGWKAVYQGLNVTNFIAVSSTRLRYETHQPSANIFLYFGKNDRYQPALDWFKKMKISYKIIENESHDMYTKTQIATLILHKMITLIN